MHIPFGTRDGAWPKALLPCKIFRKDLLKNTPLEVNVSIFRVLTILGPIFGPTHAACDSVGLKQASFFGARPSHILSSKVGAELGPLFGANKFRAALDPLGGGSQNGSLLALEFGPLGK